MKQFQRYKFSQHAILSSVEKQGSKVTDIIDSLQNWSLNFWRDKFISGKVISYMASIVSSTLSFIIYVGKNWLRIKGYKKYVHDSSEQRRHFRQGKQTINPGWKLISINHFLTWTRFTRSLKFESEKSEFTFSWLQYSFFQNRFVLVNSSNCCCSFWNAECLWKAFTFTLIPRKTFLQHLMPSRQRS